MHETSLSVIQVDLLIRLQVQPCISLSTQMRYTGSCTTSGSGESDLQQAATVEEAPKCEKCGQTFPRNQFQLRWKHKCEPTEVAHAPDPPRQWIQSSASNVRRSLSLVSTAKTSGKRQ